MPTILELFQNSTLSGQVKPDRLTGVEQEVTGIRIKSAVEINNPLIYGTDTFRIANRSTKMKDKMIELRNVGADGGTCLLYTSPSPRDRTRSRMPSSA